MKRLGICLSLVWLAAVFLTAQSAPAPPRPKPRAATVFTPPATFEKYCFECHGLTNPQAGLSLERLVKDTSIGAHPDNWERVAEMLETEMMPPGDASAFPTDQERAATVAWLRGTLQTWQTEHADEPGHVTVRRLTSGEYAYAIHDLTGIDVETGIDASSDSVGGEGFANFGDVQFVQDASIEHYLDAAKLVADHAMIGAGPLDFYSDAGRTGLELSALHRINDLYAAKGFRVVSGEGGRPFGLERYGQAFFVAWYFKHRAALGDPSATLRGIAEREGITGRFADHIWSVVNAPESGYPIRETIDRWKALPAPTSDVKASIAKAHAGCDEIYKTLTTWPSWFFARGDVAAGGAGDESPLVFTDASLKADPTHHYTYPLGARPGRGRAAAPAPAGPSKVYLNFTNLNPTRGVTPVVIWKNARVITRGAPAARGGPGAAPAGGGRGGGGPILSTQPLRSVLKPEVAASLGFGKSPDGSALGADDFAISGPASFELDVPPGGNPTELQADVELGRDKNAVVRLVISDRAEGSSRDAPQRVILGDQASAGYKTFRAGMAEYVALLPPNSHGEANPADKDPVPDPFDSTFNTPEHDAFVLKVKYQRNDRFFTENMVDGEDRARLNQAWNDLMGSWPYHDGYLEMLIDHYGLKLKSRHVKDLDAATIAAAPAAARPHLTTLRASYDAVMRAQRLAQPGHVADALKFASRAWRRPLSVAEQANLRGFYQKARVVNHLDHDAAMRALVARVLVSPAFLYRVETVGHTAEQPLNGWEMASRMSFFLWSSIPDEELRRAAAAGELSHPATLAAQVRRMTADPKARRLATEFFGQWLGFYHFDEYRGVDTGRFPEFTEEVKTAMYNEAVSTFEYIVRQQRPVKEILYADYTFLNKPLAKFYGVDKDIKSSDAPERIDGAGAFSRGGVLRLGAVLTTTSAPLRTSPVKRGDWILRRILGTPTPPPPANAGVIPGDDQAFNGLTLRERLAQHKRNPTCATCHLRIDPLGFPLEGFDAVGRVRAKYADGKPVDVTGEFADKTTIVGADGLLKYLQGREPQVMTTLSRKMLGYALGRTVQPSDRRLVEEMVAAGGSASFADLAVKIVSSRQFRNHAGEEDVDTAPPPSTRQKPQTQTAAAPGVSRPRKGTR